MRLSCCWCRFLPVLCVLDLWQFGFGLVAVVLLWCGLSIWLFVLGIWFRVYLFGFLVGVAVDLWVDWFVCSAWCFSGSCFVLYCYFDCGCILRVGVCGVCLLVCLLPLFVSSLAVLRVSMLRFLYCDLR